MDRIPILQMGNALIVSIQVDMHDRLAMKLQDDLTSRISETNAKGVLIDISALEIVDSFIGRMIANISGMARIMDAETVLVGMQPAVAITLVELGLSLPGVRTALVDKQRALLDAGDWVAEGRDIGTVVAPGAELKVFLTAAPEERARRRATELGADWRTVLADQTLRDEQDRSREASPLRAADDAVELDTTGRTVEEVVEEIVALARRSAR